MKIIGETGAHSAVEYWPTINSLTPYYVIEESDDIGNQYPSSCFMRVPSAPAAYFPDDSYQIVYDPTTRSSWAVSDYFNCTNSNSALRRTADDIPSFSHRMF